MSNHIMSAVQMYDISYTISSSDELIILIKAKNVNNMAALRMYNISYIY